MSTEVPANSYLARTLEPDEREHVEALRRQQMVGLAIAVAVLLIWIVMVVLFSGQRENIPLAAKVMLAVVAAVFGIAVWRMRRETGRIASDLEQETVYRLETNVERKRQWRQKSREFYQLQMAGERFNVSKEQWEAVAEGSACNLEFLPTSRLALTVNGIKRWS